MTMKFEILSCCACTAFTSALFLATSRNLSYTHKPTTHYVFGTCASGHNNTVCLLQTVQFKLECSLTRYSVTTMLYVN